MTTKNKHKSTYELTRKSKSITYMKKIQISLKTACPQKRMKALEYICVLLTWLCYVHWHILQSVANDDIFIIKSEKTSFYNKVNLQLCD